MRAISAFRTAIASSLSTRGLEVGLWQGVSRRSPNLLEIRTKPKPMALYVKESNSSSGFWGLTKNQLDRLNRTNVCWFAVFLARGSDAGYVLSGDEVNNRVQDGTFELSHDGDYKVNGGSDFGSVHAFRSIGDLLARVL